MIKCVQEPMQLYNSSPDRLKDQALATQHVAMICE